MHSADKSFTGQMVALRRRPGDTYDVEYFTIAASEVANYVKHFPAEWILPEYRGISQEAYDYLRPLIDGTPYIMYKDGLPAYVEPYYLR